MQGQRVLVTGATGFVGRNVVARLLSEPFDLTLAVRNRATCPSKWSRDDRIRVVETGRIETSRLLGEALAGVSIVVHLAGLVYRQRSTGDDHSFVVSNTQATERLVQASVNADVRTFIYLSSLAAITGNESSVVIDDHTDNAPFTPYGRSKRAAEAHVLDLPVRGVFSATLRPPLIVGYDAKGNWGSLQRLAASGLPLPFGRVCNRRSLVSVETVADAIARLCSCQWHLEKSGAYCLADDGVISLAEIMTELRAGMGIPDRLFSVPPSAIYALARLTRQHQRAAGLLGDLQVDGRRFRDTFEFGRAPTIRQSIRDSGQKYRQSRLIASKGVLTK